VPQLFVGTGAARWDDPGHFFWTMGWQPSYRAEGQIYAQYLLQHEPRGKVGILYQDDAYGRDYVEGLSEGLSGKISIVAELPYEVTDQSVDLQMVSLQVSGADVFLDVTTPKFASAAIKKTGELGWTPLHLLNSVSTSVSAVLEPAGFANARAIVSAAYPKDPADPKWSNDPGLAHWSHFMSQYLPGADRADVFAVYGYSVAQTLVQVLRQCGHNLTRENVMMEASKLHDLHLDMLLPDIVINTGPTEYAPVKQLQMMRFTGEHWQLFGPLLAGRSASG
jgi:branched-chain amino acid transport system substrate-binding protein